MSHGLCHNLINSQLWYTLSCRRWLYGKQIEILRNGKKPCQTTKNITGLTLIYTYKSQMVVSYEIKKLPTQLEKLSRIIP